LALPLILTLPKRVRDDQTPKVAIGLYRLRRRGLADGRRPETESRDTPENHRPPKHFLISPGRHTDGDGGP
jgi:hypothetical protein